MLRWDGVPSPDGNYVANHDKNQRLWVLDVAKKAQKQVAESANGDFGDIAWSPDSRWLAYTCPAANQLTRIFLYEVATARSVPVTTDRYDSVSPAWSPDGKWLYFLSNRNFESLVGSPWGSRQPEPFYDRQTKIYHVALKRGERSPFQADDELQAAAKPGAPKPAEAKPADASAPEAKRAEAPAVDPKAAGAKAAEAKAAVPAVVVDADGLETRLLEVPVPAGNYADLSADGKRLYFLSRPTGRDGTPALKTLAIDNKKPQPETFIDDPRCRRAAATTTRGRSSGRAPATTWSTPGRRRRRISRSWRFRWATGRSTSIRAPSGGKCSPRRGASSGTTSTIAACTASTGRPSAPSTSRWSIA